MTEALKAILARLNDFFWGPPMLVAILGVGVFLMIGLRAMPWRGLVTGIRVLVHRTRKEQAGDISPFNALMTSLSATVGTGNIAGVATAIYMGGPGALFWMWCTALVGMATKYTEAFLAVKYREVDEDGRYCGGPMYYIRNGLGRSWAWLAVAFALFGMLAGFGIGNTVQANSVADALGEQYGLTPLYTGVALAGLVGLVIIGGVRWIAAVAGKLVPFMAVAYLGAACVALLLHADQVPAALALVFRDALTGTAAQGGFAGAAVMMAVRWGVARGVFSNEAGLGSAPIAHAAARTDDPVRQGMIAMLGTCIDTLVICTLTGLVIIVSGEWLSGENGAPLSAAAFVTLVPAVGDHVVSLGLAVFAFTTLLGWSYYGERCAEYLLGVRVIPFFRLLWVLAIPLGATQSLTLIWAVADLLNALMALPNLLALVLLSPVVFNATRQRWRRIAAGDTA